MLWILFFLVSPGAQSALPPAAVESCTFQAPPQVLKSIDAKTPICSGKAECIDARGIPFGVDVACNLLSSGACPEAKACAFSETVVLQKSVAQKSEAIEKSSNSGSQGGAAR